MAPLHFLYTATYAQTSKSADGDAEYKNLHSGKIRRQKKFTHRSHA